MMRTLTLIGLVGAAAPAQVAKPAAPATIPLCPGLTVVGAVSEPRGDYEPIVTVQSITATAVNLQYSAQVATRSGTIRQVSVQRSVLLDDLESATFVNHWFSTSASRTVRGSTAIGVSAAVLRALKTKRVAEVALVDRVSSGLTADAAVRPNIYDYLTVYPLQHAGVVTVPVTVNDVTVEFRAIHARGEVMGDVVEMVILDDESNPLHLKTSRTSLASGRESERTQVVKVSHRCPVTEGVTPKTNRLEQVLLLTGRAEVYGIYFAFDSDEIRKESDPTLGEIAAVLTRYPDWKMGIEGHTDSIANDQYNLDLSRRRAGAVKAALTTRFGIDAARLNTAGFGETRPRDRNDTLEGRARNRRVELVRQ